MRCAGFATHGFFRVFGRLERTVDPVVAGSSPVGLAESRGNVFENVSRAFFYLQ